MSPTLPLPVATAQIPLTDELTTTCTVGPKEFIVYKNAPSGHGWHLTRWSSPMTGGIVNGSYDSVESIGFC